MFPIVQAPTKQASTTKKDMGDEEEEKDEEDTDNDNQSPAKVGTMDITLLFVRLSSAT